MPTRIRARTKDGEIVTVLDKTIPKKGQVAVRTATGFRTTISARDLTAIPTDEPGAVLRFGDDAA